MPFSPRPVLFALCGVQAAKDQWDANEPDRIELARLRAIVKVDNNTSFTPTRPLSREVDDGPMVMETGTSAGGLSRGGSRQQSRGRGSRSGRGAAEDGSDPFPAAPEGGDEEDTLAYQQQLAALRGEGPDGDGAGNDEGAKKAAEKVPQVAEKKYAIKSKAKVKSKLEDEAAAQQAGKKKKRKGGEGDGNDFNAEDYEDVVVPGPRPGAPPEELLLREAVVNALLAHLGTRQVSRTVAQRVGSAGWAVSRFITSPYFYFNAGISFFLLS